MIKHIHIYLSTRTKDTGNFKEDQHKRDDGEDDVADRFGKIASKLHSKK